MDSQDFELSQTTKDTDLKEKKTKVKKVKHEPKPIMVNKEPPPTFVLPQITKPPIFESKQQMINFFSQDTIAPLRPLGKIVGLEVKI